MWNNMTSNLFAVDNTETADRYLLLFRYTESSVCRIYTQPCADVSCTSSSTTSGNDFSVSRYRHICPSCIPKDTGRNFDTLQRRSRRMSKYYWLSCTAVGSCMTRDSVTIDTGKYLERCILLC